MKDEIVIVQLTTGQIMCGIDKGMGEFGAHLIERPVEIRAEPMVENGQQVGVRTGFVPMGIDGLTVDLRAGDIVPFAAALVVWKRPATIKVVQAYQQSTSGIQLASSIPKGR